MSTLKAISGAALAVMALAIAPGALAQPKDNNVNNGNKYHNHDDGKGIIYDELCFLTQQPTLWLDSFLV
jgi:hypothetical protein